MAISPDGRYVVTVNAGFGTYESKYDQSLAVLDTQTGRVADFPDARTLIRMKQTLYSGLAFSRDGSAPVRQHRFVDGSRRDRRKAIPERAFWFIDSPMERLSRSA